MKHELTHNFSSLFKKLFHFIFFSTCRNIFSVSNVLIVSEPSIKKSNKGTSRFLMYPHIHLTQKPDGLLEISLKVLRAR